MLVALHLKTINTEHRKVCSAQGEYVVYTGCYVYMLRNQRRFEAHCRFVCVQVTEQWQSELTGAASSCQSVELLPALQVQRAFVSAVQGSDHSKYVESHSWIFSLLSCTVDG